MNDAAVGKALRDLAALVLEHLTDEDHAAGDNGTRRRLGTAQALHREIESAFPAPPAPKAATMPPAPPRAPERIGGPLQSRPVAHGTRLVVARDLDTPNMLFRTGESFPVQDPRAIRSYGPAYGVPDADRRAISELDYVEIRAVG
jgi:hypothetical protein